MTRDIYRCKQCHDTGHRKAEYRTMAGYKDHMKEYHGLRPRDLINVIRVKGETNGGAATGAATDSGTVGTGEH